jgi:hypothetical protein
MLPEHKHMNTFDFSSFHSVLHLSRDDNFKSVADFKVFQDGAEADMEVSIDEHQDKKHNLPVASDFPQKLLRDVLKIDLAQHPKPFISRDVSPSLNGSEFGFSFHVLYARGQFEKLLQVV